MIECETTKMQKTYEAEVYLSETCKCDACGKTIYFKYLSNEPRNGRGKMQNVTEVFFYKLIKIGRYQTFWNKKDEVKRTRCACSKNCLTKIFNSAIQETDFYQLSIRESRVDLKDGKAMEETYQ